MIFLLDIILGLNLLWAYKSFKNIVSPPVLVGVGMFIASLVATSYYREWEMNKICFETVFFLGFGTLFFTLSCQIFRKEFKFISHNADIFEYDMTTYNIQRIKILLSIFIIMGAFTGYFMIKSYAAMFGSYNSVSELIFAVREDGMGDNDFNLPIYLKIPKKIITLFSFLASYWVSIQILSPRKDSRLIILCLMEITVVSICGFLGGNKAAGLDPLMHFAVIFIIVFFAKKRSLLLKKNILYLLILGVVVFSTSFDLLSSAIGRNVEDRRSNNSLLSTYIGAEIKNFDLYIQGKYKPAKQKKIGELTFSVLYKDIEGVKKQSMDYSGFLSVGFSSLGNVYTQAYYFHRDFGGGGVFFMTFVVAFMSMFLYNKMLKIMNNPNKTTLFYLYLYSVVAMPLFMTFFSSRFTEAVFQLGFVKMIIYLLGMQFFIVDKLKRNRQMHVQPY